MISDTLWIIYLISFLVLIIALFLNVTGTILLWKFERGNTNQRTILLNLSICQATISCVVAVIRCSRVIGLPFEDRYVLIVENVPFLCFIQYYFIMMIMTIDRFIGTKYPLRCADIFSKRRLKMLLLFTWSLCVIIGILSSIFYNRVRSVFEGIVFPVLDIVALSCIGIAYGYIMFVVNTRKLASSATARRNTESKQLIKMTAIIALTFVLSAVIPDFVLAFIGKETSREILATLFCCFYLGLVADPITYLLIRKRLRRAFVDTFKCCKRKQQDSAHRQPASSYTNNSFVIETKM